MKNKQPKTQVNILMDEQTRARLAELQRMMEAKGFKASQGQAIAYAITFTLEEQKRHKDQGSLI